MRKTITNQLPFLATSVAAVLTFCASIACGALIDFDGSTIEITPGNPTVEGNFVYDAFSGNFGRENSAVTGIPPSSTFPPGALYNGVFSVVRSDVVGGLFTVDSIVGTYVTGDFLTTLNITIEGLPLRVTTGRRLL